MERLYQPDFSSIFGANYANAFLFGRIDSLIWPIFNDIEPSSPLENLLKLRNNKGENYFYRRRISVEDEKVELHCSNIKYGLIQAMALDRSYGIANEDVINVVRRDPEMFRAILSFNLKKDVISELESIQNQIPVIGIAIYPSYIKLNITDSKNENFNDLIKYCKEKSLFLKLDIGNINIPENYTEFTTYDKIKSFLSNNFDTTTILSGLDVSGDFNIYYQLLKRYNNVWVELEPRCIGGFTPTSYFRQIFALKGFIQNAWHRITIGSSTPSLEISQMWRGFLEATHDLTFAQRNILRTWAFRNLNKVNSQIFASEFDPEIFNPLKKIDQISRIENSSSLIYEYKVDLRSYAITQLLFLTNTVNKIFEKCLEENPDLKSGDLTIRSYHTTTSLLINEHEYGNYLDLHYRFAEISSKDSDSFLHTIKALENRADFNHYDHWLASSYGHRQLTIPIVNGKMEIGDRENFYILVTFGPRTVNIYIKIKLVKEQ
ncbi:MAG: YjbQ family protein [Candidatus Hermodarchaeota archaeon]